MSWHPWCNTAPKAQFNFPFDTIPAGDRVEAKIKRDKSKDKNEREEIMSCY